MTRRPRQPSPPGRSLALLAVGIVLLAGLAGAAAWWFLDRSAAAPATGCPTAVADVRPLTRVDYRKAPRFSPDGRWILFTGEKFRGLYVIDVDGREPVRTLSEEEFLGWPARWDADGIRTRTRDGREIRFRDPLGTPVREETGANWDPRTPEGPVHAYQQEDAIHVVRDGEDRVVTDGQDRYFLPILSPDGNLLAYSGLETDLHVMDLATGRVTDLGKGLHPAWVPDSTGFVYDVTRDDSTQLIAGELWFWSAATGDKRPLTGTGDVIETTPVLSPDGRKVAFEASGTIYVGDVR